MSFSGRCDREEGAAKMMTGEQALVQFETAIQVTASKLGLWGPDGEDACQEARVAVWRRAPEWDPAKGAASTFFVRVIQGAMQHWRREQSRMIDVPAEKQRLENADSLPTAVQVEQELMDSLPAGQGWQEASSCPTEAGVVEMLQLQQDIKKARLSSLQSLNLLCRVLGYGPPDGNGAEVRAKVQAARERRLQEERRLVWGSG